MVSWNYNIWADTMVPSVGFDVWKEDKFNSGINSLRPRQNGRHFADDIFKYIFLNENVWTPIKISLKFVPKGPINDKPALVQIMAWRRPGDKPLSEPMLFSLPTHICVTRPQWVNIKNWDYVTSDLSFIDYSIYHNWKVHNWYGHKKDRTFCT